MSYGQTTSLKFFKTLNQYKNSTGTCMYYVDSKEATSYGHWKFLKTIKGKLIFNNYSYSVSTSSHQSCVREVLKHLKIKIDFTVYQRESLDSGIKIDHILESIELAKLRLQRKGISKKSKSNLEYDLKQSEKELKEIKKALKISVPRDLLKRIKKEVLEAETSRLERDREARKELKKRVIDSEIKEKLKDLGSIDLLSKMSDVDDFGSIKF